MIFSLYSTRELPDQAIVKLTHFRIPYLTSHAFTSGPSKCDIGPMYSYSTNILLGTIPHMPAQTKQARPMLLHCTIVYSADIDLLSAFMSGPGKQEY